jgi:hypothetical protein
MFRYLLGPFPIKFCLIQYALKNGIYSQILLYLNGIILFRYIFIFWLKNPTVFQDDFWNLFINIWIFGFVIINQIISSQMPGRRALYYYTCSGLNPALEKHSHGKYEYVVLALLVLTILIHLFISIRLYFYRKDIKIKSSSNITNNLPFKKKVYDFIRIENDSLTDITTSICTVFVLALAVFIVLRANRSKIQDLNCFPNYLYEYFIRMIWPNLVVTVVVLLQYYRNPTLRASIQKELYNFMYNLKIVSVNNYY